ncbi:UNVERIFIED_CONTAM: hypothetical protein FKN15_065092 [Acipenser sinensis]
MKEPVLPSPLQRSTNPLPVDFSALACALKANREADLPLIRGQDNSAARTRHFHYNYVCVCVINRGRLTRCLVLVKKAFGQRSARLSSYESSSAFHKVNDQKATDFIKVSHSNVY